MSRRPIAKEMSLDCNTAAVVQRSSVNTVHLPSVALVGHEGRKELALPRGGTHDFSSARLETLERRVKRFVQSLSSWKPCLESTHEIYGP